MNKLTQSKFLLSILLIFAIGSLSFTPAFAALGNVTGVGRSGDTVTISIGTDQLIVQVCKPELVKVDYLPGGASSSDTPVIGNTSWSAVGATIDTASNPMVITTTKMVVKINKTPCRLSVFDTSNNQLLKEQDAEGVYNDGVKFNHSTGENFYGIGGYQVWEDSSAGMLRNSGGSVYAGQQGHCGGPIVFTTKYGLLVDSDGGSFTINGTDLSYSAVSKTDIEYYVAVGQPKEVVSALSAVTGRPPMFPKWALGFINTEWEVTQAEMLGYIDKYRAKNIPIDCFIADFDWKAWGENNYGEWRWNSGKFPDGSSGTLKTTLDGKGMKMGGIMKPRIIVKNIDGTTTTQAQDCINNGWWYPGEAEYNEYFTGRPARDINFANSAARQWYFDHIKGSFDTGIVGWWNDEADSVDSGGYHFDFDNFQFLNMERALYDGQRAYSTKRVWSINRNFYLGAQRYAYGIWSGDIETGFTSMANQRERMLTAINVGAVKWGMDAGGFGGGDTPPQNFARWMQFNAFVPIFRVHGTLGQQRQPWFYGSTGEEVIKQAIQLRYRLLPYIYSYERQAYDTGIGMVKPLFYDYPTDSNVVNYKDAWMFGDYLLAAPVVDFAQNSKSIYLPAGTWTDFFRGDTYSGGQTIKYPVNADTWTEIPIFIKKGAIIPSQDVLNYVGERTITTVYVDVFADTAQSSFNYYDDDGQTYNYEGGTYFKQVMTAQDNGAGGISFSVGAKSGSYAPGLQYYLAAIHGKAGTGVTINGSSATGYADLNALKVAAGEGWVAGKDLYGNVTYVKVAAGSAGAKNVVVTGSGSPVATVLKYEAEDASLTTGATKNTNHTGYSGTGFVDGFNNFGAMATFSVNVRTGGDYDVTLRYANASGSAKTVSILINSDKLIQTSLPTLANWDTWSNKVERLPLVAGNNVITYKYDDGDSGNVNLDYITVPFNAAVAKYEAESADLSGGAATNTNHFRFSGAGFTDKLEAIGATAAFRVYAPTAGTYYVALRYANSMGSTRTLSLYLNGAKVRQVSLSNLPNWETWADKVDTVTLTAGVNTITYKYDSGDSGYVNLDRILVATSSPAAPITENNAVANGNFERGNIDGWTEWHDGTLGVAYGVDFYGVNTRDKKCYFHKASAYKQSIHQICSVANGTYKMTACVLLQNNNPTTARAEIASYGGTAIYNNFTNNGRWTYITIDNINVTTGQVDVGIYVDSPGGTSLQIDDVRLIKK